MQIPSDRRRRINAARLKPDGQRESGMVSNTVAEFGGQPATVEYVSASDVVLATGTLPVEADTTSEPKRTRIRGRITATAAGTPATVRLRVSALAVAGTFSSGINTGEQPVPRALAVGMPIDVDLSMRVPDLDTTQGNNPPPPPPPPVGTLPATWGIEAPATATGMPFTVGIPLARGALPAGQYLTVSATGLADVSIDYPLTYDDGSRFVAFVHGRSDGTAGTIKTLTIGSTTTAPAGAAMTVADLQAQLASKNVVVTTPEGSVSLAAIAGQTADFFANNNVGLRRVIRAEANVWEGQFTSPVGTSPHQRIYINARVYKNGRVRADVYGELGYLRRRFASDVVGGVTITVGGVTKWTAASFSHWVGSRWRAVVWSDNGADWTPAPDAAYLRASRHVLNTGWNSPDSALLDALPQGGWVPWTMSGLDINTSGTGEGIHIGTWSSWNAKVAQTGDPRAVRANIFYDTAAGVYPIYRREETTLDPVYPTDYPTLDYLVNNNVASYSSAFGGGVDIQHQPNFGYLSYLLTGDYFFSEQCQLFAGENYLRQNYVYRGREKGYIITWGSPNDERGTGHGLRTLAHAVAVTPPGRVRDEYRTVLNNNIDMYHALLVAGNHTTEITSFGSKWTVQGGNTMGMLPRSEDFAGNSNVNGGQGDTAFWGSPFQHGFVTQAFKRMWEVSPVTAAQRQKVREILFVLYRLYVMLAGPGGNGTFNYRRWNSYILPWFKNKSQTNPTFFANGEELQIHMEQARGWSHAGEGPGLPLLVGNTEVGQSGTGSSDIPTGYIVMGMWNALTSAVEDGFPGANEALARLEASPTFAPARTVVFNSEAKYGTLPRTRIPIPVPVDADYELPTAGNLITYPNTALGAAPTPIPSNFNRPSTVTAVMNVWSTPVYVDEYGSAGGFGIFATGGHAAEDLVDAMVFDHASLSWHVIPNPAGVPNRGAGYTAAMSNGAPWWELIGPNGRAPAPAHTYCNIISIPGKGTKGTLLQVVGKALLHESMGRLGAYQCDLETGVTTRASDNLISDIPDTYAGIETGSFEGGCAWDPVTRRVIHVNIGINAGDGLAALDVDSRLFVKLGGYWYPDVRFAYGHLTATVDAERRILFVLSDPGEVGVFDMTSPTTMTQGFQIAPMVGLPLSSTPWQFHSQQGRLAYDEIADCYFGVQTHRHPSQGNDDPNPYLTTPRMFKLKPPSAKTASAAVNQAWTITEITPPAGMANSSNSNKYHYNRFYRLPKLGPHLFGWFGDGMKDFQILNLQGK